MPVPNSYAHAPRLPEQIPDLGALVGAPGELVELEVGPGRGSFAMERLVACPETRLVGLEIKRKWAALLDERLQKLGLGPRGRIFCEDVRSALPRFPAGSVRVAYFHFPDPWWKKRHQKRLVVAPPLLTELARVIVSGGELFLQTDVEERALAYESTIAENAAFRPSQVRARVAENPYSAMSPREKRATADGLPIFRLKYTRC